MQDFLDKKGFFFEESKQAQEKSSINEQSLYFISISWSSSINLDAPLE